MKVILKQDEVEFLYFTMIQISERESIKLKYRNRAEEIAEKLAKRLLKTKRYKNYLKSKEEKDGNKS